MVRKRPEDTVVREVKGRSKSQRRRGRRNVFDRRHKSVVRSNLQMSEGSFKVGTVTDVND